MPGIDIEKRNRVLRRHCPELFEGEAPARHGKLRTFEGEDIDALMIAFDEGGRLTEAWVTTKDRVISLPCDDAELQESLSALREAPPETDTVIIDVAAISRAAGRDVTGLAEGAMMFAFSHLRGKNQREIAVALLEQDPSGPGPQRVETLSLDEFFDGNGDDSSIAPNMVGCGHPGIDVFREVLHAVRARPEVLDVRIGVHEWPYPDEEDVWISGEQIFFWTRGVTSDEILAWIAPLKPEGVSEVGEIFRVIGGPAAEAGVEAFWTTWD